MPSTWLRKEWHLREEIDAHAPKAAAFGVYALGAPNGAGGFYVDFVGLTADRAEELRRGLHAHDGAFTECTVFKFELFDDEHAAFACACRIFHTFNPELNDGHPEPVRGASLACPVPECESRFGPGARRPAKASGTRPSERPRELKSVARLR